MSEIQYPEKFLFWSPILLEWKLGVVLSGWMLRLLSYKVPLCYFPSGDVSPRCIEGFRQQRLSCPARGNRALSNAANGRNAPLTSSGTVRTGDALNSRGKPRKVAGNEGRLKNRGAGEPAGGATQRVRPTQNLHSETFTSSLSRTSPVQPRYCLACWGAAFSVQWLL